MKSYQVMFLLAVIHFLLLPLNAYFFFVDGSWFNGVALLCNVVFGPLSTYWATRRADKEREFWREYEEATSLHRN